MTQDNKHGTSFQTNNNGDKPQLHQSHLGMLSRCGIQFQRCVGALFGVWHEREILPPGVAMVTGTAVHKAVEVNLQHKIDTGELLEVGEVCEVARDTMQSEWENGMQLTVDETINVKKTLGSAIDQSVSLAALHSAVVAPVIEPVAVEEPFVIELTDYPIDLGGRLDIREANALRDTKTAGRKPGEHDARSLQMAMYCLNWQTQNDGELPEAVYIDALVKTKTPQAVTVSAVPELSWMDPLKARILRFIEIIEAVKEGKQVFAPADTSHPWACTKRFCGFVDSCPYYTGRE